jgi:hypothetical protein
MVIERRTPSTIQLTLFVKHKRIKLKTMNHKDKGYIPNNAFLITWYFPEVE